MSNASLYFILDEGLETFLEIYILLIYVVTRLQNYRTYRLLALLASILMHYSIRYSIYNIEADSCWAVLVKIHLIKYLLPAWCVVATGRL